MLDGSRYNPPAYAVDSHLSWGKLEVQRSDLQGQSKWNHSLKLRTGDSDPRSTDSWAYILLRRDQTEQGVGRKGELTTAMMSWQALPPQLLPEEIEGRHVQGPRDGLDYRWAAVKEEAFLQPSAGRQLGSPRTKGPQDPGPAKAAELR